MASLMIITQCLLVCYTLEWRSREGLRAQDLAFPDWKGNPTHYPTARRVLERLLGMSILCEG